MGLKKKLKKVYVDRSKWLTPDTVEPKDSEDEYGDISCLYNDGMKCCLGFWSEQILGFDKEDLNQVAMPDCLYFDNMENAEELKKLAYKPWLNKAAKVNDSTKLSKKERESKLKKIFEKAGYHLIFKGAYAKKKKRLFVR